MKIQETRWSRIPDYDKVEITKELFSADVPWGLYNIVPDSFRKALYLIDPRWMSWKEETLARKADISDRDENFRLAFWTEYNTCKDMGKKFAIHRVMAGVCSPYYYKTTILKKPMLMAYMVYPPTDYLVFMQNMLYKGQKRMQEVMSASAIEVVRNDKGEVIDTKVDMKLANLQLKTFALIDNRVKGAIVQRVKVEQKNLNVNVTPDQIADAAPKTLVDIDNQISQINRELSRNSCEIARADKILDSHTHHTTDCENDMAIEIVSDNRDKDKKH